MLLGVTAIAAAGAGLSAYYFLFRRVHPRLSTEQLHQLLQAAGIDTDADDGLQVETDYDIPDSEKTKIKEGFLAGSDFRWMLAGKDAAAIDHDAALAKQHYRLTMWLCECVMKFAQLYGHVIAYRDKKSGELLGCVSLIPPYQTGWLYKAHFMRTVVPLGRPVPSMLGADVNRRFEGFLYVEKVHEEVMHGQPHWYVANLGVAPSAQGRGIGRRLLTVSKALAGKHPLFLECHDGNVPFYQKFGYEVASRFDLAPTGETSYHFNAMVNH